MASLDELYRKKEIYVAFKSSVQSLIPLLSTSEQQIRNAVLHIVASYRIDDEQADKKQIYQISKQITSNKSTISSGVVPAIEAKIKEIEQQIEEEIERIERIKRAMEAQSKIV